MEAIAYHLMAALEAEHWWYRGRRAVIRRLLSRLDLPADARLLDVGSGTGGNLGLLGERGRVTGVEPSPEAADLGAGAWAGRVVRARAAELPFASGSFDVVAALDVLEHLHDEIEVLDEFHRVLRRGGHVVLFVPAFAMLSGHEDVVSRHLRRYRAGEIRRLLEATRFEVRHLGHATTLLFPLAAAVKVAKRLVFRSGPARADVGALPPRWLNEALAGLLEAEAEVTATAEVPRGASFVTAARKGG